MTSNSKDNVRPMKLVFKLGSSSICNSQTLEPQIAKLSRIVDMTVNLHRQGHKIVIVSSGGVACGLARLGMKRKPKETAKIQALAAVGQNDLMKLWDTLFKFYNQPIAQVLLTRSDVSDSSKYRNAESTINELLNMGIVPIINENDTLAIQEVRFGDNDTLSAITAGMIQADLLFLMTDVSCLYTDNPRRNSEAQPIYMVSDISQLTADVSSTGSSVGTGGMKTKIIAAELATSAGCGVIICNASKPENLPPIIEQINTNIAFDANSYPVLDENNQRIKYTYFSRKSNHPVRIYKLLGALPTYGRIIVDKGAFKALLRPESASLLPVGVVEVAGSFSAYQAVNLTYHDKACESMKQLKFGKAIVNYSSGEIDRLKGHKSNEIYEILGYSDSDSIVSRHNIHMVLSSNERKDILRLLETTVMKKDVLN